jgi:hypothetical protein
MKAAKYPFHVMVPGHPPRPMLPVRITNPATGLFVDAWGLVDTGADDCALPTRYAAALGHNLKAGLVRLIGTGNGTTRAYAHTTRIDVLTLPRLSSPEKIAFTIPDTLIDFLPRLGCVLLGVRSFLSHFILTINYPEQWFAIRQRA